MIVVCSMFAFPWCEASTVPAINHVKSLTLESESAAPGERHRFLGIREQRVTHIVVFILIGKVIDYFYSRAIVRISELWVQIHSKK